MVKNVKILQKNMNYLEAHFRIRRYRFLNPRIPGGCALGIENNPKVENCFQIL